ncbi:MAG: hypothetical protein MH204_08600 [Fimbriimonadaceae bacterium]|nr:hypothetical protein [Fimbriimonadaceae bacterium]
MMKAFAIIPALLGMSLVLLGGCATELESDAPAPQSTTEQAGADAAKAAPTDAELGLPDGLVAFRNEEGKLYCPLMRHAMDSADEAEGYVDHNGKRYYMCCASCLAKAQKDPSILP